MRNSNYPDRRGPSDTFVENSIKLTCLEITCYRIKYSVVASRTANETWSKCLDVGKCKGHPTTGRGGPRGSG